MSIKTNPTTHNLQQALAGVRDSLKVNQVFSDMGNSYLVCDYAEKAINSLLEIVQAQAEDMKTIRDTIAMVRHDELEEKYIQICDAAITTTLQRLSSLAGGK